MALDAALDRVLAEDVVAGVSVPPHDNSAVDGYAVRFEDLSAERDTVLPMPDDRLVLPGHGPATTMAQERATNPYLQGLAG